MLINVARSLEEAHSEDLDREMGKRILQIYVVGGRMDLVARGMLFQSREVYGVDGQTDYVRMIQQIFNSHTFTAEEVPAALEGLQYGKITGVPYVAAGVGILEAALGSPKFKGVADDLLRRLSHEESALEVVSTELPLTLLKYFHALNDETSMRTVGRLLAINTAAQEDKIGLPALNQSYKLLRVEKNHQRIAFDIVRQYVRRAPDKPAARAVAYFTKEIGPEAGERLEIANQFSGFIGRLDFVVFADAVNETATLLQTIMEAYGQRNNKPPLKRLNLVYDNLRVRMEEKTRREFAGHLQQVAKNIVSLGKAHESSAGKPDGLVKGSDAPRNGVDVWRFAGGHVARGRALPIKLTAVADPLPFGDAAPDLLRGYAATAAELLYQAAEHPPQKYAPAQFTVELDSLLNSITLEAEANKTLQRQLAIDLQRLAELVVMIYKEGDVSAVEEDSRLGKRLEAGQQEPRTPLEMLRFFYGKFLRS
jgi:hypothetical protein